VYLKDTHESKYSKKKLTGGLLLLEDGSTAVEKWDLPDAEI